MCIRGCGKLVCGKCKPICKENDEKRAKMPVPVIPVENEPIEQWPITENSTILVDIGRSK